MNKFLCAYVRVLGVRQVRLCGDGMAHGQPGPEPEGRCPGVYCRQGAPTGLQPYVREQPRARGGLHTVFSFAQCVDPAALLHPCHLWHGGGGGPRGFSTADITPCAWWGVVDVGLKCMQCDMFSTTGGGAPVELVRGGTKSCFTRHW